MKSEGTTRTHIVLPTQLLEQIDELVGPRHRSEFIAEALAECVRRKGREAAFEGMASWPERERSEELGEFEDAAHEVHTDRRRVSSREQWLEDNWYNQPE